MIRTGAITWRTEAFGGGQDSYHAKDEIPPGGHAVIRNLWTDGETLKLRGGSTGLAGATHIGHGTTVGAKGLYVWYPDNGNRHILAAYPKAGVAGVVNIWAVHTSGSTALGIALASAPSVAFAGFGDKVYISDGRTRLAYTDGVVTGMAAHIDRPAGAAYGTAGIPKIMKFTAQHDRVAMDGYGSGVGADFPSYVHYHGVTPTTHDSWTEFGTGMSANCQASDDTPPNAGLHMKVWLTSASPPTGIARGVRYTYGTGGTSIIAEVLFWAKSTRMGGFLSMGFGPRNGSGTAYGEHGLVFNQTGIWERKVLDFRSIPLSQRMQGGTTRIRVTDASATFTVRFGRIALNGGQFGSYELAPAFYRSSDDTESPLAPWATVETIENDRPTRAIWLPKRSSKDVTVDKVRWYRRGGGSPEWRRVAEMAVNTSGWDFARDDEAGDIADNVPPPAPRMTYLGRFGESRAIGFSGYDIGDSKPPLITTAGLMQATSAWTAMGRITVAGVSKGVELFLTTAIAGGAVGTLIAKLQKKVSGSWLTQQYATSIPGSQFVKGRWNQILWRHSANAGDKNVTLGTGVWRLVFSAAGAAASMNKVKVAQWNTAQVSFYHLLDCPARVWVSRRARPTWFDRYTPLESVDEDGFCFDLPRSSHEVGMGMGDHGSTKLLFTRSQTFLLAGDSAADAAAVRMHNGIGCASGDTVAEGDDWTFWVSGAKGALRVYAYGPKIEGQMYVPAHDKGGFNRIGLVVEPILNLVLTPARTSAEMSKGRYHLFFGEVVTYQGVAYTGVALDLATRSWQGLHQSVTNVKPPRFVRMLRDTGQMVIASPASTTAPAGSNRVWDFDNENYHRDGAQSIGYVYETRHTRLPEARETKLRGYSIRADAAAVAAMAVYGKANNITRGTFSHTLNAGSGTLFFERRFGPNTQGENVGLKLSGTATTDVVIRSIELYLDRKR